MEMKHFILFFSLCVFVAFASGCSQEKMDSVKRRYSQCTHNARNNFLETINKIEAENVSERQRATCQYFVEAEDSCLRELGPCYDLDALLRQKNKHIQDILIPDGGDLGLSCSVVTRFNQRQMVRHGTGHIISPASRTEECSPEQSGAIHSQAGQCAVTAATAVYDSIQNMTTYDPMKVADIVCQGLNAISNGCFTEFPRCFSPEDTEENRQNTLITYQPYLLQIAGGKIDMESFQKCHSYNPQFDSNVRIVPHNDVTTDYPVYFAEASTFSHSISEEVYAPEETDVRVDFPDEERHMVIPGTTDGKYAHFYQPTPSFKLRDTLTCQSNIFDVLNENIDLNEHMCLKQQVESTGTKVMRCIESAHQKVEEVLRDDPNHSEIGILMCEALEVIGTVCSRELCQCYNPQDRRVMTTNYLKQYFLYFVGMEKQTRVSRESLEKCEIMKWIHVPTATTSRSVYIPPDTTTTTPTTTTFTMKTTTSTTTTTTTPTTTTTTTTPTTTTTTTTPTTTMITTTTTTTSTTTKKKTTTTEEAVGPILKAIVSNTGYDSARHSRLVSSGSPPGPLPITFGIVSSYSTIQSAAFPVAVLLMSSFISTVYC